MMDEFTEDRANWKWNTKHPSGWPRPPRKMPAWFNFMGWMKLRDLEEVFGYIDQDGLNRYWAEVAKGQSIYEDAGGYMVRCYGAMMGKSYEAPYTYPRAIADLMAGKEI